MSTNIFHYICIIESLPEGEYHTGKRLYEDTLVWENKTFCLYKSVYNSSDFFRVLEEIKQRALAREVTPLLHLEVHGCEEGIILASGKLLKWQDLEPLLREINILTRNNLVVILAACNGIHIGNVFSDLLKPAPISFLIASIQEISSQDVENGFKAFYTELFRSNSLLQAILKINNIHIELKDNEKIPNQRFYFYNCDVFFKDAYSRFYREYATGKAANKWIETNVTQAKALNPHTPISELRQLAKLKIKKERKEYFEKWKRIFFMIDLYPENEQRFDMSFEEIINYNYEKSEINGGDR